MDRRHAYEGQEVLYRAHPDAQPEGGVIVRFGRPDTAFVLYAGDSLPKATRLDDLTPRVAPLVDVVPWRDGYLATLDTETTGTDPENDRIVTAVLDVYGADGTQARSTSLLVNPGVEIPQTATDVHGITNEQAQAEGVDPGAAVAALIGAMYQAWADDLPIVVYNAAYDLTLIDRESRRHLATPLTLAGPIIDPMVIDRHVDRYVKGSGQRQLQPTCARYDIAVDDWHTASADAYAAQALARAISAKHDAQMPSNLGDMWRWQRTLRRDQAKGLQDYFASIGKTNDDGSPIVIPGDWPMIPPPN
jgi:DNA polymerase-3 subunit epsilon